MDLTIASKILGRHLKPEDIEGGIIHEEDGNELDYSGDYEIGYYKICSTGCYILCNERVDTTVQFFNPETNEACTDDYEGAEALKTVHFHRRNFNPDYRITWYK